MFTVDLIVYFKSENMYNSFYHICKNELLKLLNKKSKNDYVLIKKNRN